MLRQTQSAITFIVALITLLSSVLFPTPATARPLAQPNAPEAPQAILDTPTTIVNEYADEWLIHKGVVHWADNCPFIPLAASASNAPDAPTADVTAIKRTPVGGGAVVTLTTTTDCVGSTHLAVDDSGMYYFDGAANKIKVVLANRPTPVITDVISVSDVTKIRLDDTFVYFTTFSNSIFRVPKTGGTAQAVQATSSRPSDFIFNDQSIYWFDNTGLWWGPKTCATFPCSKISLSSSARGRNMQFGNIGEAGSSPGSIVFVNNSGTPNFRDSIIELNCQTPQVCQIQTFRTAEAGWSIGEFKFVFLFVGPLPSFDPTMFWVESSLSASRLLRRLKSATTATPSEIYPGSSQMNRHLETDNRGVYFSDDKIKFLPFTASSITRDLAVANIEVTQAIQNLANQIGLVADKTTYARVYGRQNNGPPAGSVTTVLHGTRNGLPLPGSPLQPLEGNVALNTSFVFDRANRYHSWLFRLPNSWITAGNIVLRAEMDPRNSYEDPTTNNDSLSQSASFGNEPDACLFFTPIRTNNPIPKIGDPNFWATMERFARVWPIPAVEVRSLSEPIEELQACYWHGIPYPCWGPYELDQASDFPSNFPSDKDRVIGKLMLRQAIARAKALAPLAGICESGATVHAVGLVHPQADTTDDDGTLGGYANYYINASFYKMEKFDSQPVQGSLAWVWPKAASVLAQEVTHNFNRRHAACGTTDATDGNWPYINKCQLNDGGAATYYGFDVKSRTPIPPEIASDFMSYTPSFSQAPKWKGQWVSDYTYSAVKGKFGLQAQQAIASNLTNQNLPGLARPQLPEAGEMIYAIGAIEPISGLGKLDYAYAQPLAAMSAQARGVWQEFSTPSWRNLSGVKAAEAITYHLRLKDASGAVLDDRAVTPYEADSHEGETPAWPFLVTFPAPSGTVTKIELLADDTIIDTITMGPATPNVSIVTPKAGDVNTDALVITWQGSDADPQDELHYNVEYSADNGTTWIPLVEDFPGTPGVGVETLVVQNPLALPGTNGATGRIRVYASDGYHTGSALSGAFSVAQRAPEAHITSPTESLSYNPNDEVALQGGAIDAESGMLTGTALSWAVGGIAAGSIATGNGGEESSVRGLKPGMHTVMLTATDNTSRTGTAQAALHINPLIAGEGGFPALDGLCDDAAYSAGASQIQLAPYAGGAQATAQVLVNNGSGKLWLCLSGLARGGEAQVGRAGLWADVNNSQDGATQASDVGFFVAEDGAPIVTNANASAIDARVTATGTLWTAELSINLASLGGNGHVIGARLSHNGVNDAGDAFAWPYRSLENAPSSWGATVLGNWPVLAEIAPVSATVGSGDVVLTLTGSNFATSTVARLDGVALNTTFVSATQMSAVVPAAQLTVARTAKVQVVGAGLLSAPSPAAGLPFEVMSLAPTITALTPDTAAQGSAISMTVTGSGFAPGALVLFDGVMLPTTFVNATQVRALLGAAQMQAGRVVQVAVQNAGPGDGLSNELAFLVSSPRTTYLPFVRK